MMRHPSNAHKMLRDVEAFARDAAHQGIDVTPLHTASAFHAEADAVADAIMQSEQWKRMGWWDRMTYAASLLTVAIVAKSRPRKARALEAVKVFCLWLLLVAALFIVISALFASSARADGAVDAWEAEYGPAACDFLGEHPTIDGLSGVILGAEQMGLTARQAGEAVASSVLDMCPDRTPILRQFVMRYGPVSNV